MLQAAIFSLQAHSIWRTFQWSRKFEDLFCLLLAKFISYFLLCPAEYLAYSFMKQQPWRTVSPSLGKFGSHFLWFLHVQFIQHTIKQSRQEQFLAQMASLFILKANSMTSFFNSHQPLWTNWCCQKQTCFTVEKSLSS